MRSSQRRIDLQPITLTCTGRLEVERSLELREIEDPVDPPVSLLDIDRVLQEAPSVPEASRSRRDRYPDTRKFRSISGHRALLPPLEPSRAYTGITVLVAWASASAFFRISWHGRGEQVAVDRAWPSSLGRRGHRSDDRGRRRSPASRRARRTSGRERAEGSARLVLSPPQLVSCFSSSLSHSTGEGLQHHRSEIVTGSWTSGRPWAMLCGPFPRLYSSSPIRSAHSGSIRS